MVGPLRGPGQRIRNGSLDPTHDFQEVMTKGSGPVLSASVNRRTGSRDKVLREIQSVGKIGKYSGVMFVLQKFFKEFERTGHQIFFSQVAVAGTAYRYQSPSLPTCQAIIFAGAASCPLNWQSGGPPSRISVELANRKPGGCA